MQFQSGKLKTNKTYKSVLKISQKVHHMLYSLYLYNCLSICYINHSVLKKKGYCLGVPNFSKIYPCIKTQQGFSESNPIYS